MTQAKRSHRWIGKETHRKEADFSGLVGGIHIPICSIIRQKKGRPGDPPYLFADLHGGPGRLRDDSGRRFDGSPLIAVNALARSGLRHETLHFEKDPDVAAELTAVLDPAVYPDTTVCETSFEEGIRHWLKLARPHDYRYGLVYSDPIEDPIPVDVFNLIAEHSRRVDLLAYVAANNQYKRANANGYGHGRRLADDVAAVRKKKVLIRAPAGAEQYTFILFTDWTDMPEWKKRDFHEVKDTGPGRTILERLNLTKREQHEQSNTPLWEDGVPRSYRPPQPGDAPYRSYQEYLKHSRFLEVRAEVFTRAAGRCERCTSRPPTEPHHLRYPPWGAFDVPENMIAVCHRCHCEIHGKAS